MYLWFVDWGNFGSTSQSLTSTFLFGIYSIYRNEHDWTRRHKWRRLLSYLDNTYKKNINIRFRLQILHYFFSVRYFVQIVIACSKEEYNKQTYHSSEWNLTEYILKHISSTLLWRKTSMNLETNFSNKK